MVALNTCGKVTIGVAVVSILVGIILFFMGSSTLTDAGTVTFLCADTKSCTANIPACELPPDADDSATCIQDLYSVWINGVPSDEACEENVDTLKIIDPDGAEHGYFPGCEGSTETHQSPEGADEPYGPLQNFATFGAREEGGKYVLTHPKEPLWVLAVFAAVGEAVSEGLAGLGMWLMSVVFIIGGLICCCAPFCCCKAA